MALYMHVDDARYRSRSLLRFDHYNDDDFYCRYRFHKDGVRWLTNEFSSRNTANATRRSIPGHIEILLALRYTTLLVLFRFLLLSASALQLPPSNSMRFFSKKSTMLLSSSLENFIVATSIARIDDHAAFKRWTAYKGLPAVYFKNLNNRASNWLRRPLTALATD